MNTVEPIRYVSLVNDIADYLREQSERNYILFLFGIYSGLRISDILKLRVRDVRGKEKIIMREKKTGKERKFPLNKVLKASLANYINTRKDYEFLFSYQDSRRGVFYAGQVDILDWNLSEHILCGRPLDIICTSRRMIL